MLSDNSKFGVRPLTEAINRLPAAPTQIRDLALFETRYLNTTYVDVENQSGELRVVQSQPRGNPGNNVPPKHRESRTFKIPHLPVDDVVRADDVQNIRAFGSTQAETVQKKVDEKLADGKAMLEITREHLMLGALQGKILDADGTVLYDLYKEFGLKRQTLNFDLGNNNANVGLAMDKALAVHKKLLKGAMVQGWVVLCGIDYLTALKYHPSVQPLYQRYMDGKAYREGNHLNTVEFEHNGVKFIHYTGDFGAKGAKIADNQAILLPVGRKLYAEFFAPADMSDTVNTTALAYYASREPLDHKKGWSVHMQSNPLPMALRPELVASLEV